MDTDLLDELNRLADNAESLQSSPTPDKGEIERWMNLFSYTDKEASSLLALQITDVTRDRLSDEHWSLISTDVEAAGHSRLSWEHLLGMKELMKANSTTFYDVEDGKRYTVLRMLGWLSDEGKVRDILRKEKEEVEIERVKGVDMWHQVVYVDDEGLKKIEEFIDGKLVLEKKGTAEEDTKKGITKEERTSTKGPPEGLP
jgi:hypothetical protein